MEFYLERDVDPSGISGTGRIAHGILFDDGRVAMRWMTDHRSTALYESLYDVYKIHAHGGQTRLVGKGCTIGLALCGDERSIYVVGGKELDQGERVRVLDLLRVTQELRNGEPRVDEHFNVFEGSRANTLNRLWTNMSQATFELGGPGGREPIWGDSPPKFDVEEVTA